MLYLIEFHLLQKLFYFQSSLEFEGFDGFSFELLSEHFRSLPILVPIKMAKMKIFYSQNSKQTL